jgi:diguanylate cyclase (GGDEF)-like protein
LVFPVLRRMTKILGVTDVAPQLDLLTGAWKRDYFELQLARAVSDSHRARQALSIIQLDVDDLQEHNDLHGASTLNESLGWVAIRMSQVLNGRGPIARIEGGTFATFLPQFTLPRALAVAERIRSRIHNTRHASQSGEFQLSVSMGVACLRANEPWGNLLDAVDAACRKAKQGGRDLVVHR